MIKLTVSDMVGNLKYHLFINKTHIESMYREEGMIYTTLNMTSGTPYFVLETPEEIISGT